MHPQLIDRIYECAFVPEHWPLVLGELATVAGARAGFLFVSNEDVHHWTSSTQVGIEALTPLGALDRAGGARVDSGRPTDSRGLTTQLPAGGHSDLEL